MSLENIFRESPIVPICYKLSPLTNKPIFLLFVSIDTYFCPLWFVDFRTTYMLGINREIDEYILIYRFLIGNGCMDEDILYTLYTTESEEGLCDFSESMSINGVGPELATSSAPCVAPISSKFQNIILIKLVNEKRKIRKS